MIFWGKYDFCYDKAPKRFYKSDLISRIIFEGHQKKSDTDRKTNCCGLQPANVAGFMMDI